MTINLTFFMQMIHFLIAYKIIETFFLRPLLQIINQERKQYDDLVAMIHTQQQLLKAKEELKITQWRTIKQFFATIIPKKTAPLFTPYKQIKIPAIKHKELKHIAQEITTFLIKRIRDAS